MMALIAPFVPEVALVPLAAFFARVFVLMALFRTRLMTSLSMFAFWAEMAFSPVVAFLVRLVIVVLHKKSSLFGYRSALVEKVANLKVMRVCNTLITFKFALLQGTAEQ